MVNKEMLKEFEKAYKNYSKSEKIIVLKRLKRECNELIKMYKSELEIYGEN